RLQRDVEAGNASAPNVDENRDPCLADRNPVDLIDNHYRKFEVIDLHYGKRMIDILKRTLLQPMLEASLALAELCGVLVVFGCCSIPQVERGEDGTDDLLLWVLGREFLDFVLQVLMGLADLEIAVGEQIRQLVVDTLFDARMQPGFADVLASPPHQRTQPRVFPIASVPST